MNAKQRIENAAKAAGMDGRVWKGHGFSGYGYYVEPFGQVAEYLGKSVEAAVETLGQMEDYRAELAEEVTS